MKERFIFGKRTVFEALEASIPIEEIVVSNRKDLPELEELVRSKGIHLRVVDSKKISAILGSSNHQGIAARLGNSEFQYREIEDILDNASRKNEKPFVAILDEITDPHNLGAIVRCAECAGVHGIIIPQHRSAGVNATVLKTSAGAVLHIPIVQVTNLSQTILKLKERGFWIYGTTVDAKKEYYEIDCNDGIAVIIGSEGEGLRKMLAQHCDFTVRIPMYGKINSLNASVAAGIIFFDVARRRHGK